MVQKQIPTAVTNPQVSALLKTMLAELSDPAVQYMVSTAYIIKPDNQRLYMMPIWFHADTTWNLKAGEEELTCDLIMQEGSTQTTRVRIPFAAVYRISRMTRQDGSGFEDDDSLYWNQAVFDGMFVEMKVLLDADKARQESAPRDE